MSPIAKALSTDDVANVTAYYNGVTAPFPPLATADPSLVHAPEQLATMGDATKNIPARTTATDRTVAVNHPRSPISPASIRNTSRSNCTHGNAPTARTAPNTWPWSQPSSTIKMSRRSPPISNKSEPRTNPRYRSRRGVDAWRRRRDPPVLRSSAGRISPSIDRRESQLKVDSDPFAKPSENVAICAKPPSRIAVQSGHIRRALEQALG